MYVYDESWSSFPHWANPAPRGMDLDEDSMIWIITASRLIYRFDTSGGNANEGFLSELPASFSCACAVFPYIGNTGILVGGNTYGNFYFYEYDGASLSYLDSAPEPSAVSASYDVCCSADRDTWAGIKASF